MKSGAGFLVIALLSGTFCFGQNSANRSIKQQTPDEFSIDVVPPSDPVRLGSPIKVTIKVTVGDKEIIWTAEKSDTSYRAFQFLVTKDGKEAETTVFERQITGNPRPEDPPGGFGAGSTMFTVAAGSTFSAVIDLAKLYEIIQPGVYTLDVSRKSADGKITINAKPVSIVVVK